MDYWLRKIFNKIYALLHIKTGTIITLVDLVCIQIVFFFFCKNGMHILNK
jgi:hypothetical protein